MLKNIFAFVILIALFGACTQDDPRTVDPIKDDKTLNVRSTEEECDSIQDSYPDATEEPICYEVLLQCRLNQGINEKEVRQECNQSQTYNSQECVDTTELLTNYDEVVEQFQMAVANNTDTCPGNCQDPNPITGCRTIIFRNVNCEDGTCPLGEVPYSYDAVVYCCN